MLIKIILLHDYISSQAYVADSNSQLNNPFHQQNWPELTSSLYYYKEETIDQTDTNPDSGIIWNQWITSENGDQGDWAMHPPFLTRIVMDRLTDFGYFGNLLNNQEMG